MCESYNQISKNTSCGIHLWCVLIMQWFPFCCGMLFTIHVLFLLLGINIHVAELLGSCSLFVFMMLIVASIAYRFCFLHRVFLVYNYIVSMCIEYENYIGFGKALLCARIIIAVIGIILVVTFIVLRKRFNLCQGRKN